MSVWKSDEKLLSICILNFSFKNDFVWEEISNIRHSVSSPDETLRLMFDILHQRSESTQKLGASSWTVKIFIKRNSKQNMIDVTGSPVQTDATYLANNSQGDVASVFTTFARCCMLLRVVGSCCPNFKTGKTFKATTPNISFFLGRPSG